MICILRSHKCPFEHTKKNIRKESNNGKGGGILARKYPEADT